MPRFIICRDDPFRPYNLETRKQYLKRYSFEWNTEDERDEAKIVFDNESVGFDSDDLRIFEEYEQAHKAFNDLCDRKLAQRKPAIYDLMSRIYDVFEKYGLVKDDRYFFILRFVKNIRETSVSIGKDGYYGKLCWWRDVDRRLRFYLHDDVSVSVDTERRIGLVNKALESFIPEFYKTVGKENKNDKR